MKCKLSEHFGDQIAITNINGKTAGLTLRTTVSQILHEFYAIKKSNDPEQEKMKVVRQIQMTRKLRTVDVNYPSSTSFL
jgi:hypothetical protein